MIGRRPVNGPSAEPARRPGRCIGAGGAGGPIAAVIMELRNSPEPLDPDEFLFFVSNQ